MTEIPISAPTYRSLLLKLYWLNPDNEYKELSTGTGFLVQHEFRDYLITNRHVLSGRTTSGEYISSHGVAPTHVRILHNSVWKLGEYIELEEPLFDEPDVNQRRPRWLEHPRGFKVDVVALPVTRDGKDYKSQIIRHRYELPDTTAPRPYLRPSDTVHIVGFPFGLTSHGSFAIWTKGSMASEPELDYGDAPRFLVDARTREGQSGSPVIVHFSSNTPPMMFTDNTMRSHIVEKSYLLGVYSGRVNKASDIGIVWKASIVATILKKQLRNPLPAEDEYTDSLIPTL
ncbi:trypsin-like peptidase [Arthrobacter sp. SLBN-100]|uniref:S1 family peptidase n=1 Tax=Arthrobacter sp. SLBN-100 TaxID=2768450 RepID=UPI001152CB6A|nr:serine protease [Arthrobacter sp. SLBN-100]TQJ68410.1 trypsin-like peptidase [Arthrobacter sp. SLBN-100]